MISVQWTLKQETYLIFLWVSNLFIQLTRKEAYPEPEKQFDTSDHHFKGYILSFSAISPDKIACLWSDVYSEWVQFEISTISTAYAVVIDTG